MSFLSSNSPTLTVLKLTGYLITTINSNFTQTSTNFDKLTIFLTFLHHIFLNFIYIRSYSSGLYESFSNEIIALSAPALVYFDYICNTISAIWLTLNCSKFIEMLKNLSEIDENFESFKFNYANEKKRNLKIILTVSFLMILLLISDFIALKISHIKINDIDIYFYCFNYFSQIIQLTSQILIIQCIKKRIKIMQFKINLKILLKNHIKIIKVVNFFNRIFSPLLFLYMADFFCWLCVMIFDMSTLPYKNIGEIIAVLMMNIPHTIYMISMIFCIIKAVEEVKSEMQKLLIKIYEIEDENEDFGRVSAQIVSLPVRFTCGLINYDWRLFFKVRIIDFQ